MFPDNPTPLQNAVTLAALTAVYTAFAVVLVLEDSSSRLFQGMLFVGVVLLIVYAWRITSIVRG